jgi:hypothetical protein
MTTVATDKLRPHNSWLVIALLPPATIAFLISHLAVNVPFQDDWDAVTVLTSWHEGNLRFDEFWQQHSEHRIPSIKLLIWLLGLFSRYNVVWEMMVGFGFACVTFLLVRTLIAEALTERSPQLVGPLSAVASFLLFSLTLRENWFWGLASLQLFLLNLMTVTLVRALTRWPRHRGDLVLALACAIVGMFSEASGLGLWVTGALAIWWSRKWKAWALMTWVATAVITIGVDLWTLDWEGQSLQAAASPVERFLLFFAGCLGLPLAYGTTAAWSAAAITMPTMTVLAVAIVGAVLGYVNGNIQGYRETYAVSRNLHMARASLTSNDGISESVGRFLYSPEDARLRRQISLLKKLRLGPFASDSTVGRFARRESAATGRDAGVLDGGNCYRVEGWAWDPARPDVPVRVDIWRRGTLVGTATANWFRSDLLQAGIGDGEHAFVFMFPTMLEFRTGEAITVKIAGTDNQLRNSPQAVFCD